MSMARGSFYGTNKIANAANLFISYNIEADIHTSTLYNDKTLTVSALDVHVLDKI